MTPGRLWRFFVAYTAASATVVPVALGVSEIAHWFDYKVSAWHVGLPIWLAAVGVPTVGVSIRHLNRTLGVRPTPVLKADGVRSIPVMGDVARLFGHTGGQQGGDTIHVVERIVIQCGDYIFTEDDLLPVLRKAWIRQRRGQHALSRRFWLGREPFLGDRAMYDAFADALEAVGVLVGRKDGASGKLVKPPLTTVYELRHRI